MATEDLVGALMSFIPRPTICGIKLDASPITPAAGLFGAGAEAGHGELAASPITPAAGLFGAGAEAGHGELAAVPITPAAGLFCAGAEAGHGELVAVPITPVAGLFGACAGHGDPGVTGILHAFCALSAASIARRRFSSAVRGVSVVILGIADAIKLANGSGMVKLQTYNL
jgi:hypothetical protein